MHMKYTLLMIIVMTSFVIMYNTPKILSPGLSQYFGISIDKCKKRVTCI